jgi:hypothetical protein
MGELGVFAVVAEAVNQELHLAESALAAHAEQPPTAQLLRLCGVLRHQVGALRGSANV